MSPQDRANWRPIDSIYALVRGQVILLRGARELWLLGRAKRVPWWTALEVRYIELRGNGWAGIREAALLAGVRPRDITRANCIIYTTDQDETKTETGEYFLDTDPPPRFRDITKEEAEKITGKVFPDIPPMPKL